MRINFIIGALVTICLINIFYVHRKTLQLEYLHLEHELRHNPGLTKSLFSSNSNALKSQPYRNDVKIVGFADINFYSVAKYWYERLTSLGYTEHVIIAIDEDIYKSCLNDGYRVEPYYVEMKEVKVKGSENKTKVPVIRKLWYRRVQYCKEQISNGTDILLTDVDNVFHRYVPVSDFQDENYDIIHAYEQRFPTWIFEKMQFVLCGGMTWFKATSRTLHFLELLEYYCIDGGNKACNDQNTVNLMYLKYLNMSWNRENEMSFRETPEYAQLSDKDLYRKETTGISNVTNHTVKIWARDMAWRGDFEGNQCPDIGVNWVSMPQATPYRFQCGNAAAKFCTKEREKFSRLYLWEEYCGHHPDATNRVNLTNDTLKEAYDRMNEKYKDINFNRI